MRIVFIGAVEFSLHTLEHLLKLDVEIVGVCTLRESKFNSDHVDLSVFAEQHAIPCINADDINSNDVLEWIRGKVPDVIFCFGWSRLIRQPLLQLAPLGVIGFHPAALPKNRGRHPIVWALVLGLKQTASTFFFMDDKADSGDILSQVEVTIADDDDARSLYNKIVRTALKQLDEFVPQLVSGNYHRIKQNASVSNLWRKRGFSDGVIDWRMSAITIHNLVRALTKPYVGAHFVFNGQEIKVWKTATVNEVSNNIEPGKVLQVVDGRYLIKCGEGALWLLDIQPSAVGLIEGDYL